MARAPRRDKGTTLKDLVPSDIIVEHLTGTSKREAIGQLVNALAILGIIDLAREKEVRDSIFEREAVASTGIGGGLAIPHAKSKYADRFGVAVGISEGGLDFAAHDGQPVRVVFCWICPPSATQEHLALMRALAAVARDGDGIEPIARSRDRKGLLAVLAELEVEPKGK
jgi:PTS system fructose-specific IIC component